LGAAQTAVQSRTEGTGGSRFAGTHFNSRRFEQGEGNADGDGGKEKGTYGVL